MQYQDDIYGEFKLDNVLVELIGSQPVQRLKGIHQGGACYLVNHAWNVTRYEHSLGVMLLIKRLGGSIEEQIAGLLHDVSHTAFSHVVDHVFENKAEDYHEQIFERVILQSEIPNILARHGFSYQDILLDDSKWTILEQPAPELCADRIDYTLRDMYTYYKLPKQEIEAFLNQLIILNGRVYLQSIEAAEWFVELYYKEVIGFFLNPLNIYSYHILAQVLKRALELQEITEEHFLLQDDELLEKLRGSKDQVILEGIQRLHNRVQVEENELDYDLHQKNKLRLIDPSVYIDGSLHKASALSKRVQEMGEEALQKATRGAYVKIKSR